MSVKFKFLQALYKVKINRKFVIEIEIEIENQVWRGGGGYGNVWNESATPIAPGFWTNNYMHT